METNEKPADSKSENDSTEATKKLTIGSETAVFVQHMEAIAGSLPLVMEAMSQAAQAAGKKYHDYLEANAELVSETGSKKTVQASEHRA